MAQNWRRNGVIIRSKNTPQQTNVVDDVMKQR
jgi:hypothetical protein